VQIVPAIEENIKVVEPQNATIVPKEVAKTN
jgi:hypothetical protein